MSKKLRAGKLIITLAVLAISQFAFAGKIATQSVQNVQKEVVMIVHNPGLIEDVAIGFEAIAASVAQEAARLGEIAEADLDAMDKEVKIAIIALDQQLKTDEARLRSDAHYLALTVSQSLARFDAKMRAFNVALVMEAQKIGFTVEMIAANAVLDAEKAAMVLNAAIQVFAKDARTEANRIEHDAVLVGQWVALETRRAAAATVADAKWIAHGVAVGINNFTVECAAAGVVVGDGIVAMGTAMAHAAETGILATEHLAIVLAEDTSWLAHETWKGMSIVAHGVAHVTEDAALGVVVGTGRLVHGVAHATEVVAAGTVVAAEGVVHGIASGARWLVEGLFGRTEVVVVKQ